MVQGVSYGGEVGVQSGPVHRELIREGTRIRYRDHGGTGTPIVFLHGLAGHAGEWQETARRLRQTHRVIAVDQRGNGESERRPQDVSRAAYVADFVAVIDQLDLPSVALAGQSMGGQAAMLAAAAHPDRVDALVMIEAGAGGPTPDGPSHIESWLNSWPVPFASRRAAAEFFGGGARGRGWVDGLEWRTDGGWPRFDADIMVRSVLENSVRSFWDEWQKVRCPRLLVLAESGFISAEESAEMVRRRPDTTVVHVPGVGHDLHLEDPDALHVALTDFFGSLA